jgi:hypothetical protein
MISLTSVLQVINSSINLLEPLTSSLQFFKTNKLKQWYVKLLVICGFDWKKWYYNNRLIVHQISYYLDKKEIIWTCKLNFHESGKESM